MCNGQSNRESQGGTIAVLNSSQLSTHDKSDHFSGELFFRSAESSVLRSTEASFQAMRGCDTEALTGCWVVIHKDGDLSKPVDSANLLHKFVFEPSKGASPVGHAQMNIDQELDLRVGGNGIIGRRISIFKDAAMGAPVAEGIIGWN